MVVEEHIVFPTDMVSGKSNSDAALSLNRDQTLLFLPSEVDSSRAVSL